MRLLYICSWIAVEVFVAATAATAVAAEPARGPAASLERVLPLLESRCITCHGPDAQEGELRLDSRAAALKGGKHGPALRPGEPKQSLLLQAALHERRELAMPPKEKLSTNELAAVEEWIREGAPWPEGIVAKSVKSSVDAGRSGERLGNAWSDRRNPIVRIFDGKRLDLWSLRPVHAPELPTVNNKSWVRNPIDRLVLARLEAAGVQPSPEAILPAFRQRPRRWPTFSTTGGPMLTSISSMTCLPPRAMANMPRGCGWT